MEFRGFYKKSNFQAGATASSYLEVNSETGSTKLSCTIYGPMQKQQSDYQGGNQDQCSIKVNIDFADSMRADSLVLEQFPQIEEQLTLQMGQMQTKGSADSVKEKRVRQLINSLQFEMLKVLNSCILVEQYPATSLVFSFNIVEMDSDIIQSMVNCAAVALYNSQILCRCIPTAITLYLSNDKNSKGKDVQSFHLDPNISQIKSQFQFSHKCSVVINPNTSEIISQSIMPLGKMQPLDLFEIEKILDVCLAACKKIHEYIIDEDQ